MLSKEFTIHLQDILSLQHKTGVVKNIIAVGGGSINRAYSFNFGDERFFLKVNKAKKFPGMFQCEALGLSLLAGTGELRVPGVILEGQYGDDQFLVLEHVERAGEEPEYFYELGQGLASLHQRTNNYFGLDHSNYIGSLPQDNTQCNTWSEFFVCRRIEPLLKESIDKGHILMSARSKFNSFFNKMDEIFPNESPAFLHGDLWSGNKMNTTAGPSIFDPAVYYGHREMDLAMSHLFGGFGEDFYTGYNDKFPLEKGWNERIDLCNLYPLLVHTVLFGGSYGQDVIQIIRKF